MYCSFHLTLRKKINMLVSYLFWFITLTLFSSEVNGTHFLSNLCTDTKIGTYAYPGVNNVYFECEYGNATIYACPPGENFDPIFTKCSEKEIPYDRSFCSNKGLYLPHPFDCTKFIGCFNSKINIINCKTPMVYSIDTNQCEYRIRVSACKHKLAENELRPDLNIYIHYNPNEIIGKKRDIWHELSNFDKEADEDIDKDSEELNSSASQSSHELNELTSENEIRDDEDPSTQTINFSGRTSRKSKQNDTKIDKTDKLSIEEMNTLLTVLGAPFNISIKKKHTDITVDNQAVESIKNLFETFFSTYAIDKRISSAPFISTSERAETTLKYSENDKATVRVDSVVSQRMNTHFLSTTSNSVSEIANTDISSTVEETSSLEPKLLDSRLNIIDKVASGTENIKEVENITVNDSVLKKVENTIVPVLMTETSTPASTGSGETLSTNSTDSFNGKKSEHNTISSQHEEESLSSSVESRSLDTEIDIFDSISKVTEFNNSNHIEVGETTEMGKSLESTTSILVTTESTKLKEVDGIRENTESTPVSTQYVKVTSSTIAVDEASEKVKTSTDGSTLQENVSEEEIFTSFLSTPSSILEVAETKADDIEGVTAQSVTPFLEKTTNIPIVENLNANIAATIKIESTTHSVPLEIASTTTENDVVTTGSHKDDSTSSKPEYISTTDSQENDKIPTTSKHADFTETTTYIPLVYTWRDARSSRTVSVSKQRLRLNGNAQANYGYVEVKGIDDIWRGVCQSTDWTIAEADIICRKLGYQNSAQKAWKGHSNQVEIPAWTTTSSIQCRGDEDWVDSCRLQDETECDLQHNAVGVECILSDTTPY